VEKFKEYENAWIYHGSVFDGSLIGDNYGFVYKITCSTTNRSYIGRKYFWQKRKPRAVGQTTKRRRVTSESDWRKYYGSCPELKEDVKQYGRESFAREILSLHRTPGRVNYEETRQLFLCDVLTKALTDGTPAYYNSNILGRYYRKDYFDFGNDSGVDAC
jgi:hypothetical protein|tara:strand:+ start:980 stop:1459 length:480 start_codon:yes stop_codon:yes gene_type:complete